MIYLYIDSLDFFSKFCQKNFWLVRTIVLSKFQRTLPLIGAPCGNLTRFGSFFSLDLLKSKGRPLSYTFLCLSSFFFIFFSIFFKIALPTPKPVNTQMPPNFIVKRPRIKPPPPQQVKIFFFFFFIPPPPLTYGPTPHATPSTTTQSSHLIPRSPQPHYTYGITHVCRPFKEVVH